LTGKVAELEAVIKSHEEEHEGIDFLEVGEGGSVMKKDIPKEMLDEEIQTLEIQVEEVAVVNHGKVEME
jgi:hypothetical protein